MSGRSAPYHLRPNKAVDRAIFVDLLHWLSRYADFRGYTYISFGGAFLEDFRRFYQEFAFAQMISLESDPNTHERQSFNKPIGRIECRNQSSTEFIRNHEFSAPSVVWLDYTSAKRLGEQCSDVSEVLQKLGSGDILKVTLNAEIGSIAQTGVVTEEDLPSRRNKYVSRVSRRWCPADPPLEMFRKENYPCQLLQTLAYVCDKALDGEGRRLVPLVHLLYRVSTGA